MIKVSIIKNNKITNEASFNTEEEADIWLKSQLKNKSFGEVGTYKIKVSYGDN
jgi:hypothetical protein